MPQSPFTRAATEQSEGSSDGGKRSSRRNKRQKVKERYAKAREDAQLLGVIPTVPEGAVRPEKVPQSVQVSAPVMELAAQMLKRGWKVDEDMKPHLVDELVQIVMGCESELKHKIAAFNALRMADDSQY